MVNVANATVDTFIECMRANRCGVHGPLAGGEAAAAVVRLAIDHTAEYAAESAAEHAGRADVAIPVGDPLVLELEIERLLDEAGASVLRSDAADWDSRLGAAAVGITGSLTATAERGSIVLGAGPGLPRATSLLPPVHICLVRVGTIVPTFPEAIDRLASLGPLPSALTWIGGPSRTGDLEMKTTFGVHGPKTVEIVLVDD